MEIGQSTTCLSLRKVGAHMHATSLRVQRQRATGRSRDQITPCTQKLRGRLKSWSLHCLRCEQKVCRKHSASLSSAFLFSLRTSGSLASPSLHERSGSAWRGYGATSLVCPRDAPCHHTQIGGPRTPAGRPPHPCGRADVPSRFFPNKPLFSGRDRRPCCRWQSRHGPAADGLPEPDAICTQRGKKFILHPQLSWSSDFSSLIHQTGFFNLLNFWKPFIFAP